MPGLAQAAFSDLHRKALRDILVRARVSRPAEVSQYIESVCLAKLATGRLTETRGAPPAKIQREALALIAESPQHPDVRSGMASLVAAVSPRRGPPAREDVVRLAHWLRYWLVREGLKNSHAPGSLLVKAVAEIFSAIDIDVDARALLRRMANEPLFPFPGGRVIGLIHGEQKADSGN